MVRSTKKQEKIEEFLNLTATAATQTALDKAFPAEMAEAAAQTVVADIGRTFAQIPIHRIRPNPYQPRKLFDEGKLLELAESIKEEGILQPLIVRRSEEEDGAYELAAGERRWRAAQLAGLAMVPCEILKECSNARMRRIAVLENILREQLTPLELAHSYKALLEERDEEERPLYNIRSLAEMLKRPKDHVDSHLALLRVPDEVRQLIEEDPTIPLRIIREIGGVEDAGDRELLIREVRARSLNQADVLAILQEHKLGKRRKQEAGAPEQEPATSIILRAVLQRKLQREQGTFKKSLQRIEGDWEHLDTDGKRDVRTHLEQMLEELQGVLQRHPLEQA